jgi:hypothetical protein
LTSLHFDSGFVTALVCEMPGGNEPGAERPRTNKYALEGSGTTPATVRISASVSLGVSAPNRVSIVSMKALGAEG